MRTITVEADKFFVNTKLLLKVDNELWSRVVAYQVEKGIKNRNNAVKELLVIALEHQKHEKLLATANSY